MPSALSRDSGKLTVQVSPHPWAPGALSPSQDGALWVWYRPAIGAAFSGHSFTPPWLERFLSSLWFPSQCQCPAAGWERPGAGASCLPRLPCRRRASCAVPHGVGGGTPPLALQHTGSAILAKTPPLPRFPTFTLAMHAESEPLGDTMPPAPSPCSWKQTVTVAAIPEAARCNIAPRQLDIPRSGFWNHSDMHH